MDEQLVFESESGCGGELGCGQEDWDSLGFVARTVHQGRMALCWTRRGDEIFTPSVASLS